MDVVDLGRHLPQVARTCLVYAFVKHDLAAEAAGLFDGHGRLLGALGGRANDNFRRKPFPSHQLADQRAGAFAAAIQGPVKIGKARIVPARFGVTHYEKCFHKLFYRFYRVWPGEGIRALVKASDLVVYNSDMRTEGLSFDTANGPTNAYVAMPDNGGKKAVLVIQEWWGLNDHIKDIANRYADEGFAAIAPDLYRGKIAADSTEASQLMHDLSTEDGLDTIKNAIDAAALSYDLSHFGITGYCMGGTFALRAACELEGLSAAAPFYGDIPDEEILKKLRIPTTFISGTRDGWITPEKVAALEDAAERFELPVFSVKYDADHAFFNNTRPEVYNDTAANDAWALVIAFFNDNL